MAHCCTAQVGEGAMTQQWTLLFGIKKPYKLCALVVGFNRKRVTFQKPAETHRISQKPTESYRNQQ